MKAEELMIGDWVRVIPYKKNGRIYRIDYTYGKGNEYVGVIDGDFDIGLLEPIPLTPELLEKNGFERDFEDGSLIWVDEQDVTEVVWGGTILTIHGENGHLELDTCMYVHELQHALRLCGIEKEIML